MKMMLNIFICLFAIHRYRCIYIYIFSEVYVQTILSVFVLGHLLCFYLIIEFWKSYSLDTSYLSKIQFASIFFRDEIYLYILLIVSFEEQKLFVCEV